jgi:hypothetical protein
MTEPYLDKRFTSATEAKTDLQTKEKTAGNFLQLKPKDSQVKLYRDRGKLSITYYDDTNFSYLYFFLIPMALFVLVFPISVIIFLLSARIIIYINTTTNLKKHKMITIEKNQKIKIGKYYKNPHNINWKKSSYYQDINLLAYNPGYTVDQYLDATGKVITRNIVAVDPELFIYANNAKYSIQNSKLSEAELWWLGKELSDFLELELQVIYSTPQEPPEPSCGGGC